VLLDAMGVLGKHLDALVLVGAQAIYLQAGEADLDLSVAPFTTDADFGVDPHLLGDDPRIIEAMTAAGFSLKIKADGGVEPGTWLTTTTVGDLVVNVPVDLLVPEALATRRGRRDAGLPEHGKNATRWTPGLEACTVDHIEMTIASLEPVEDPRTSVIRVAGPGALLVAKAHKIAERVDDERRGKLHRIKPKDAGDVIRLMRSPTPPDAVGSRLAELARDETGWTGFGNCSAAPVREAWISQLRRSPARYLRFCCESWHHRTWPTCWPHIVHNLALGLGTPERTICVRSKAYRSEPGVQTNSSIALPVGTPQALACRGFRLASLVVAGPHWATSDDPTTAQRM
jgi:hypothetical protein